ncbi:SpoIIE family protein phosphatase [Streptomyces californicus]|uniref:SpoIIE family protein phosphatase n=1 Tax=Streptomyces californicus TaxID=67351 RepID=UPI00331AFA8D
MHGDEEVAGRTAVRAGGAALVQADLGLTGPERTDSRITLTPGSALLLYTDGLVERTGQTMTEAIDLTAQLLTDHTRQSLPELLDAIMDQVPASGTGDDIALLALRIPATQPPPIQAASTEQ